MQQSFLAKLLQMANGAVYDDDKNTHIIHDRKLDALEDLIEGANGKPVLIAYWYNHDLERIKARFNVREIKTSKDIKDWNNGDISVAVIHPASADTVSIYKVEVQHLFGLVLPGVWNSISKQMQDFGDRDKMKRLLSITLLLKARLMKM